MQQQETKNAILPLVSRLQCRKMSPIEGSDVFAVPHGWASGALQEEPGMVTVRTVFELDAAVQDENTTTIFVPLDTFGLPVLEKILRRNGLVKTIFWEE